MNLVQRVFKNTFSNLFSIFFSRGLNFFSIIYLARIFEPTALGKISLGFAWYYFLMVFANLGLNIVGSREIAIKREESLKISLNFTMFKCLLSTLILAAYGLGIYLFHLEKETAQLFLLFAISLFPNGFQIDWVFQGLEKMEVSGFAQLINSLLYVLLLLVFAKKPDDLFLVPLCFLLSNSIGTLFLLKRLWGEKFEHKAQVDPNIIRRFLPEIAKIGFAQIMIQLLFSFDTFSIAFFLSNTDVGLYVASYKVFLLFNSFLGSYCDAIFPVLSHFSISSMETLKKIGSLTQKVLIAVCLPLAITSPFFSTFIVKTLYGSSFARGGSVLPTLFWAFFLISINAIYSRFLLAGKEENWFLVGVTVPAAVNILCNLLFVRSMGILGAALAKFIAEGCALFIMSYACRKRLSLPFAHHLAKPFFASVLLFYALKVMVGYSNSIIGPLMAGVVIYLAVLFLLGFFNDEELGKMRKFVSSAVPES